jgi:anti-anti-sigma factor
MSLQIRHEKSGDVVVLQCTGRIVRGNALYTLREAVTTQENVRIIVLDLSEVEMLDGGGLGMFVFLHNWTRGNGIQMKLVNPSSLVREMLDRTRLTCVFDISSVYDAVGILCSADGNGDSRNHVAA